MISFTLTAYTSPYGSFGPKNEDIFLTSDLSTLSIFLPLLLYYVTFTKMVPNENIPKKSIYKGIKKI